MAEQTTLYGEYDRYKSEAEFRVAVTPPLLVFVAVFAVGLSWLWALGVLPLGLLGGQAIGLQRQADLALVASVMSGKVKSPYLESAETELTTSRSARPAYVSEDQGSRDRRLADSDPSAPSRCPAGRYGSSGPATA